MADPRNRSTDQHALNDLAKGLRGASDSTLLRVIGVIDQLPDRGATDRLLDPLRPKLSVLRPPRPPNFSRVLFTPLDPVIVPPSQWRQGAGTIPRTVIAPVAELVRSELRPSTREQAAWRPGESASALLWQEAAAILGRPLPAAWNEPEFQIKTGIKPQAIQPVLRAIQLVFTHVALFRQPPGSQAPSLEALRPLLLEAAHAGPTGWCVVLTLLFESSAAPTGLIEAALTIAAETKLTRQLGESMQRVVAAVIEKLDQEPGQIDEERPPSEAEIEALSLRAARLAGYSSVRGDLARLGQNLAPRRKQMATHCAAGLVHGLKTAEQACVPPGSLSEEAQEEAMERLTARLRALRRLDLTARTLGESELRNNLLGEAASGYFGAAAPHWLTRADRLRLCEILVGAEAALQLAGAS